MSWFLVAILAYFFLALVSLFDRYLLVGPIANPKIYTFYVGILWFFVCFFLLPFGINLPEKNFIALGLLGGLIRIFGIIFLTKSIVKSEVSRVVPAIGGFLPIISFSLFFLYFPQGRDIDLYQLIAFLFLVLGSILIAFKKNFEESFNFRCLKYPIIAAFFYAVSFLFAKITYLKTNFVTGLFLSLIGGGLGALCLFIFPDFKKELFSQKITQKISGLFFVGQVAGGLGVLLQHYAIFLAKTDQVPLINALEGIRYIFLLFFVLVLSFWKPELLKEEIKGAAFFQKTVAVLLICVGLGILAFK